MKPTVARGESLQARNRRFTLPPTRHHAAAHGGGDPLAELANYLAGWRRRYPTQLALHFVDHNLGRNP